MTIGDIQQLLAERDIQLSDNNDFELVMPDGLPITGIVVNLNSNEIVLSDTEKGCKIVCG